MAYQKGRLSKAKLADLLDTSIFDVDITLNKYGFGDDKKYNHKTKVRAA